MKGPGATEQVSKFKIPHELANDIEQNNEVIVENQADAASENEPDI